MRAEPTTVPDAPGADDPAPLVSQHSETLARISRRTVSLLKEHFGKGPTRARTYHFGDLVVVLLSGGYTTAENTLLREGRHEPVTAQRAAFQEIMQPHFERIVEEELGREVIAFMSASHLDPEFNAELFVLRPRVRTHENVDRDSGE
jgi:uncharacterized protein YbcI